MRNCCVLTCDNGYEFGEPVSYHRFPLRNKPLLEKWIAAVSRESDWQPSKWTCICSAHFKTTDFIPHQRTPRLRDDAFPSIFTSTIRTQVKKKLAPDGRYDMESCVPTISLLNEEEAATPKDEFENFDSSAIQTESAVFLQCNDEHSSFNGIFFKTEAEDVVDIFSSESNDAPENAEFCEKEDAGANLGDCNPAVGIFENENDPVTVPFQYNNAEMNADEIFVCNYCNKIFDEKSHLQKHILIHMSKYFCVLCDKVFELQYDLVRHEQGHLSEGRQFNCLICHKQCNSEFNLNLHEKVHRYVKNHNHICKKCKLTLPSKKILVKHLMMHHCENFFTCDDCGKTFSRKKHLQRHLVVHKHKKEYICKICQKSFVHRSSLTVHELIHLNVSFSCKHCFRAFPLKSNLIVHELQHTSKPPFKCPLCKDAHADNKTLVIHVRKYLDEKPFICFQCGERFYDQKSLIKHEKLHADKTAFTCTHCDKSFYTNDNLIRHLQVHSTVKPFVCKTCGRAFREVRNYTRHLHFHSQENPDKHQIQQSGPKNYPETHICKYCNERFNTASTLQSHSLLHAAPKPPEQNNQFVSTLKSRFKLLLNSRAQKSTAESNVSAESSDTACGNSNHIRNGHHSASFPVNTEYKNELNGQDGRTIVNNILLFPDVVKDEPIFIKDEPEDCVIGL